METIEKLSSQGWNISDEGFNVITNNGAIKDLKTITQNALDADLKDIGKPILSLELNKTKINQVVLQIQKIRNISAPKSNEDSQAAPRMLKLILTDGHTHCQGVEIVNISFLSRNKTPPGSKLLIKNAPVVCGYILLQANSCSMLGGKVAALYEKWEINKTINKHTRGSYDGEGPPPWVNFGYKILSSNDQQPFKSLENKKEQNKDSDFDAQRQDAIAEAASGAVKKVFGGGVKQSLQVQNKFDHYNKYDQNNRFDLNSKFDHNNKFDQNSKFDHSKDRGNQVRDKNLGRKGKREVNNEEKLQKPSEKVSLFDFLEDKLPASEPPKNCTESCKPANRNNYYRESNSDVGNKFDSKNFERYRNVEMASQDRAPRFQNARPNSYNNYNNGRNSNIQTPQYQAGLQNKSSSHAPIISKPKIDPSATKILKGSAGDNVNVDSITHNVGRMSVNSEFASRSLRQHLNLGGRAVDSAKHNNSYEPKSKESRNFNCSGQEINTHKQYNSSDEKSSSFNTWMWKIGDQCMAKYWEDNKYYNATVTAITHRTCVVQFNEYGNYEEVLHCDCIPITTDELDLNSSDKNFPVEFRRGGTKTYNNNKNFYKPQYSK